MVDFFFGALNNKKERQSQGAPPISRTPVANLPPMSITLPANLPPMSTTQVVKFATCTAGVVDTGGKFATGINDTSIKFATYRWHIMGIISDYMHLKLNLEEEMYLYNNSTTQRCPNKIL